MRLAETGARGDSPDVVSLRSDILGGLTSEVDDAVKIVIAPAPFKGCLSAAEAAESMARGARAAGATVDVVPVADGGEGTLDALIAGVGGTVMGVIARGPLGLPVRAHVGVLADGTAVVEMAQASGLTLVPETDRDVLRASSYGTGEMIRAALARRPSRLLVALGGSATVDGGTGLARALGMRFLDEHGRPLPDGGGALERLARIDAIRLDPRVRAISIVAAADVSSPLLGRDGAAQLFAPQKGASDEQVEVLERGLAALAHRLSVDLGADVPDAPGAGAAGGAGAMLLAVGARVRPGIDVVLDALRFRERLRGADLVITGEGRLDRSSLAGKAPIGVARICEAEGVPCAAIVGQADPDAAGGFVSVRSLVEHAGSVAAALSGAKEGLSALAASLSRALAAPSARARRG